MQKIKQLFMTYRNGVVADTLRKAGLPHKVIFGLQLPQIVEIARSLAEDHGAGALDDLASRLWADSEVRESRILALRLASPGNITREKAIALAESIRSREEADLLVFYLLRHTEHLPAVAEHIASGESQLPSEGLDSYLLRVIQRNQA